MAPPVVPAHMPTSTVSVSPSVENQQRNPVSLLNQYNPGLNYQLIEEYGEPHLKTFTMEVIIDGQVGFVSECFVKMSYAYFGFLLYNRFPVLNIILNNQCRK